MSRSIKKEVAMLKKVAYIETKEFPIVQFYGTTTEAHGFMRGRVHILRETCKFGSENKHHGTESKALSTKDENSHWTKDYYLTCVREWMTKDKEHPFSTYEKWREYNRCKCGKHGSNNDQPYGEVYID